MARDFDLFGNPLPRNRGKVGRDEHVPTPENANKIRLLLISGWTQAAIAEELGISAPTLRKHYFRDWKKGQRAAVLETRARILLQLDQAAAAGNVSAMKELGRLVEERQLELDPPPAPPPRIPTPGKKEQALMEARSAHEDCEWGELLH